MKPVVVRRTLPAPQRRVFEAWTRPELMCRWFFPEPRWSARVEADVRVGGRYRLEMRDEEGRLHVQHGEYRVIEPISRMVFTWSCEELGVHDSVVSLDFSGRGAATELVLRHELPDDPKIRDGHEAGWVGCLANLEQFVKEETMSSIKDAIRIAATPAAAMAALTTQAGYLGWWSKECTVPEKEGGEASLKFDKAGTIVRMRFRIDRIDVAGGHVAWTCIGHDQSAWIGTTLDWRVRAEGDGVEVSLEHGGWKDAPPEPVKQGWSFFLRSLKSYLETGRGEPW